MEYFFNDADLMIGDCPFGFVLLGCDEPDVDMCSLKQGPVNKNKDGLDGQHCTPSNTCCPIKTEKNISFIYHERTKDVEKET